MLKFPTTKFSLTSSQKHQNQESSDNTPNPFWSLHTEPVVVAVLRIFCGRCILNHGPSSVSVLALALFISSSFNSVFDAGVSLY